MDIPLQNITMSGLIARTAARFPESSAIESDGRVVSYRQLDETTALMASGLMELGVEQGDHVAIWAELTPESIMAFYAVQRIGAVAVMLRTAMPLSGVEKALKKADCSYLISAGEAQCAALGELSARASLKAAVALDGDKDCCAVTLDALFSRGRGATPGALAEREALVQPGDPAVMLLTSGTTGEPKLVLTSHYSRINSGIQQAGDFKAVESDKFCVILPMFHCFCLSANLYAALSVGACVYLPKSRHTKDVIAALRYGRCTILHAVPTQFRALIDSPLLRPEDSASLRIGIIGGGGYTPKFFRRIEETLNFTLMSSLGMTEGTAGVTICNIDDSIDTRSQTLGHFMSHLEGKIIDGSGAALPVGMSGEICIRGYAVMQGYYNCSESAESTVDGDGWLHSGDFGHMDGDGNLWLEGRLKEIIIRGGENISPIVVETAILDIDGVYACKVEGVPDDYFGEEACAAIVRLPGCTISAEQIKARLASVLDAYAIPKYIMFLEELPLNDVGKIDLRRLRAQASDFAARNKTYRQ